MDYKIYTTDEQSFTFTTDDPHWHDGVMTGTVTHCCTKCLGEGHLIRQITESATITLPSATSG